MKIIGAAILIFFYSNSASAAIDCKKASSSVENLICSSGDLIKLDKEMNTSFKESWKGTVLGKTDPALKSIQAKRSFFYTDQIHWLKNVRNACNDEICLLKAYKSRISKLRSWNEIENIEDISGAYIFSAQANPSAKGEVGEECLIIKKSTKDFLRFDAIKIDDGYCEAGGKLKREKGFYSYMHDPEHDTDFDHYFKCNLKLYVKKYSIEIESDCVNTFTCGTRGSINGLMVPRQSKKGVSSKEEFCYAKNI